MTEDEVLSRVQQLVKTGEYCDWRYIRIGPLPEPPRTLPDSSPDRASWHRYMRHMPVTKPVERCSHEYPAARDQGLLTPLPPLPVATVEAVTEAEAVIGYQLPRLLRRLYLEVANGGFGPRDGILGVRGGVSNGDVPDLVQAHLDLLAAPDPPWPRWLISIFDWGSAIWSLVDCRDPAGPMWSWDGNTHSLRQHDQSVCDWLGRWLECRLDMPEGTRPRGAAEARRLRAEWNAAHPDQPVGRRRLN